MEHTVSLSTIKTANRLDAEFFNPKFLKLHNKLKNKNHTKLQNLCEFIRSGPPGSALPSSAYTSSGIKIYKPSNLNNWTCENGAISHTSAEYCKEKKLLLCLPGDILIARVGDIKFGIIQENNSTISPNLMSLRTKKELLDPYFLLAFLNHEDGFAQVQRGSKRVSLSSITTSHVAGILIPSVPLSTQKKIGKLILKALKKQQQAKILYAKAQDLLLSSIKFQSFQKNQTTKINLSKLRQAQRADAEFYLFKSTQQNQIKEISLEKIAKISRGIEPGRSEYKTSGKVFLRASNIDQFGLIDKSQKFISPHLYKKLSKKYQPRQGDILLVKDGKPGVACLLTDTFEGIISESIVRFVPTKSLSPEYIFLCINSPFCQQQISMDKEGSLQPHLKVNKIEKLKIPIVEKEIQEQISKLIKNLHKNFNESKKSLRKAKSLFKRTMLYNNNYEKTRPSSIRQA